MRVLLLNDTRADENPGCQATVTALISELSRIGAREVITRPRSDGYKHFTSLIADHKTSSPDDWRSAVRRFALNSDLASAIGGADLVVANLEGTFHHQTIGALALGGAMAIAHQMGKRVWAVNGSVEAIEPWLLSAALVQAEWVSVREPVSARWLSGQGINAHSSADCAFLIDAFTCGRESRQSRLRTVLYTPGILASLGEASCDTSEVIRQFDALARHGWKPTFLRMAAAEEPLARAVEDAGWPVQDNRDIAWQDFGSHLQQFGLVVSGRYHVLIFAAMAGVPAIALRSNTWKIQGLMELLGGQVTCADDAYDLALILRHTSLQRVDWPLISACQDAARMTLPQDVSAPASRATIRSTTAAATGLSWRTALFGASSLGQGVAAALRLLPHVELTGFLDNDPVKWGERRDDLVVARPTQEALAAADVIVITSMHDVQIRDQIVEAGFGHKLTDLAALERLAPPAPGSSNRSR
jgi:Polysaccharide pyruvyl transferase